jgi:Arm DNA-binding domain
LRRDEPGLMRKRLKASHSIHASHRGVPGEFASRSRCALNARDSLTKRTIDALAPREKLYIVFDRKLPGFGLRIAPTGRKTFVVEYRPHGGG